MSSTRLVSLRVFAVSALVLSSSYALAQQSPTTSTTRVRGTIVSLDGETLHIKLREGAEVAMHLPQSASVASVAKISLADVKPGSYIGVTTVPGPEGSQQAVEVHVFPESMRGTGEGSRGWDLRPNSSMTNGAVDKTVAGNDGHTLTVKYGKSEKKIVVTPQTEVVAYVPAQRSDIKAGETIFVIATRQADGSLESNRVSVGRDGVSPPM